MFTGMKYVYAVYENKSFSEAAKKLNISQPSLSASVKRVETAVGFPIFERNAKSLRLTECGEMYIKTAEQIMLLADQFSEYVSELSDLQVGHLAIGGTSSYSSWITPKLMRNFLAKYPQVKIELVEESSSELEKLLLSGKIDILVDNTDISEDLCERTLYKNDQMLMAVPAQLPLNKHLTEYVITPEQIRSGAYSETKSLGEKLHLFKDESFIMLKPGNDTRERAQTIMTRLGFTPKVLFELDQSMTTYNITCSGMGISFISDTFIADMPSHSDVVFYRLSGAEAHRKIWLYWKKGRYMTQAMKEFISSNKAEQ